MEKETTNDNEIHYEKAHDKIRNALKDGKWHRFKDLKKETQLTAATLSKHLKQLEKGIVEKYVDIRGNAPYPVYYRIKKPEDMLDESKIPESLNSEAYFQNVSSAVSKALNNAFGTYQANGNFEAFQQNLDSTLGSARASLLWNVKYNGKIHGTISWKKEQSKQE